MSELKPCPFCGGEPEIINRSVHCNSASCNAQPFTSWWANDDAIAAWNRRAEDAALSRLRDTQRVLVEALAFLRNEVEAYFGKGVAGPLWPKFLDAGMEAARAALASVEQPEQPYPTPAGDEEVTARDAARYRWLRDNADAEFLLTTDAEEWDAAVDAAMQEPKP